MLRLALRAGLGHPMLVTDAMPPVGGSAKASSCCRAAAIIARDGRCVTADGTLAGAALDMASAVRNCVALLDLPLERALVFASTRAGAFSRPRRSARPARAGLSRRYGGLRSAEHVAIIATWVAGEAADRMPMRA